MENNRRNIKRTKKGAGDAVILDYFRGGLMYG
nr:MAG TPA: hypothetical protein [Caudoviricetes sp.]